MMWINVIQLTSENGVQQTNNDKGLQRKYFNEVIDSNQNSFQGVIF